ncbi:M48 family metallopeptidase [Candidatus Oleimmundimicrobium sp.]|uniref:M48 family metallopeptidase n=1 Tax=Candidatus Oleimmundimicrobium sp. TaxID=3060597 RepID=UPI002727D29D|nr:M48 family metallopeptidase [Candidatus Oleimmundimicrobium sp.]MDO8885898.1 M48 family metallopeptidase [Candidatus Oleimmundimicrobium sp.]
MMKSITVEIDGVGPVFFKRSRRAKHLNISIRPFKGVRVAVPYNLSFKRAEKIVCSKVPWMQKHLKKMERVEQEHISFLNSSVNIDRVEAKKVLIKRLNELTKKHGFTYNKVFIRNQRTRLGSCSFKNNINLNMKLILLPDELIDYVILHELVHLKIKNHSKDFWKELDKFVGDAKALRSKVKEYQLGLI